MGPRGPALFHLISVLVQPVKGQATDFGHGVSIHGLAGENRRFLPPSTAHTNATQSRDDSVFAKAPLFRLGSGALPAPSPKSNFGTQVGLDGPQEPKQEPGLSLEPPFGLSGPRGPKPSYLHHLPQYTYIFLLLVSCIVLPSITCNMFRQGPDRGDRGERRGGFLPAYRAPDPDRMGPGNWNKATPPAWGPNMQREYTFRAYLRDVSIWVEMTDLPPHQQAMAIQTRLYGAARDAVRSMTIHELKYGGVRDGIAYDPVSYLLVGLEQRFAPLDEEQRLVALTEFLAFKRHHDESIDDFLSRYHIVRARARMEGNFVMSVEAYAFILLRIMKTSPQEFNILLQPFGGRLPSTEVQFQSMLAHKRRISHISEHYPGNLHSALQHDKEPHIGSYLQVTDRGDDEQSQVMPWCGGVSDQEAYNLEHNSESSSSSDATGTSSETSSDYGEDEDEGAAAPTDPAEIFWQ